MTDRELLELAAKAAGITVSWSNQSVFRQPQTNEGVEWNPLTDDGDALRLAVKLRLSIDINEYDQMIHVFTDLLDYGCSLDFTGDICADTRRAIVIAAAEIGKGME